LWHENNELGREEKDKLTSLNVENFCSSQYTMKRLEI
jgi:hypothetical protein